MATRNRVIGGAAVVAAIGAATAVLAPREPQCSDGSVVCVSWTRSTGWDDGTPFGADDQVDYPVYRYDRVRNTGVMITSTPEDRVMLLNEPAGNQCYFVATRVRKRTTNAETASVIVPPGPTVCTMVRLPAPSEGSLEAPTDGAIEPQTPTS